MVDKTSNPKLIWVSLMPLDEILHADTWLKPTQYLRDAGWEVTLISPVPSGKNGLINIRGVEVLGIEQTDGYFIHQLSYHLNIIKYLKSHVNNPETIILFHEMSDIWFILPRLWNALTKGKNRPLYAMDTRSLPMAPEEKHTMKDRIRVIYQNITSKYTHHFIDGRTAITKRMADALGIPGNKLWGIWPSGVELKIFNALSSSRDWNFENGVIELVYIGSMNYERNLMTFCKAVVESQNMGMKFRFTIVGEGAEREDLEQYAATTQGKIIVNGPVPQIEVLDYLENAHVGVLPFPDEEKFRVSSPIKLFEYMASGLPVLATRIVCHTDVIKDGDYVFWAENSDINGFLVCLKNIWNSRDNLKDMGIKAQEAATEWSWEQSTKQLEKALLVGLSNYKDGFVKL